MVSWYNGAMYGLIYCITNTVNGKQYVGQTTYTIKERWGWPLKSLPFSPTCAINSAVRKYGPESFTIVQIDEAESQDELNEKEVHHIARLGTYGGGYNLTPGGKKYFKHSPETRKKISEAQAGFSRGPRSAETRKRLSENKTKYYALAENRRKTSESLIGRKLPEETRRRLSESHKGHVASAEARRRQSEAQTGKGRKCCMRGHPFSGDNLYVAPGDSVQICLTCWYLRNCRKLPEKLKKYVTGQEVYKKKEKIAHVAQA